MPHQVPQIQPHSEVKVIAKRSVWHWCFLVHFLYFVLNYKSGDVDREKNRIGKILINIPKYICYFLFKYSCFCLLCIYIF